MSPGTSVASARPVVWAVRTVHGECAGDEKAETWSDRAAKLNKASVTAIQLRSIAALDVVAWVWRIHVRRACFIWK